MKCPTVLFDLDGTLADTAPDLTRALNIVLTEENCATVTVEQMRPLVSHGARTMIKSALDIGEGDELEVLWRRMVDNYHENLYVDTRLFDGMPEFLDMLESSGRQWGVVSNKPSFLTEPLLAQMELAPRTACIVGGDTLPYKKPHPAPILHACELVGCAPSDCLYVGDAIIDVQSSKQAGTSTAIMLFGYQSETDEPSTWGADIVAKHPKEVEAWLNQEG
ncbi:MAG: HAD-IA family hydrolase [Pseudomonadota bacterium]